jgi:hypothetical protein
MKKEQRQEQKHSRHCGMVGEGMGWLRNTEHLGWNPMFCGILNRLIKFNSSSKNKAKSSPNFWSK